MIAMTTKSSINVKPDLRHMKHLRGEGQTEHMMETNSGERVSLTAKIYIACYRKSKKKIPAFTSIKCFGVTEMTN